MCIKVNAVKFYFIKSTSPENYTALIFKKLHTVWQVKHQGLTTVSLLQKNSSECGSILYSCLWAHSAAKWVAMATFLQHLAHSNDSKRSHTLASPALLSPSNVSILQRKPSKMASRKRQICKDHFYVSAMSCWCIPHVHVNVINMILFMYQLKIENKHRCTT